MKLELFDVEDRPVAVDASGPKLRAWAWSGGIWRDAPGLTGKSVADGIELSPAAFAARFPSADLAAIPSKRDPAKA